MSDQVFLDEWYEQEDLDVKKVGLPIKLLIDFLLSIPTFLNNFFNSLFFLIKVPLAEHLRKLII